MAGPPLDVLIIGAGPTGLGAAWRLAALGHRSWRVCDAGAQFGGLAGSHVDQHGFTWDFGGHVQHSHYAYFDDLMDELLGPDGWITHRREAWIRTNGRFVPYPFQLNVHRLGDEDRDECLDGLRAVVAAPPAGEPAHFADWLNSTFGRGITRLFMEPYNRKVWAAPLETMDWRWIGDRVAVADFKRVLDTVERGRDDTTWGPNHTFRFPRRGGTGAVWTALGERLARAHSGSIQLQHRLVSIDCRRRRALFENGEEIAYQRLITTVPLDRFVAMSDLRQRLQPAAAALRYTPTHLLGVALHGQPTEAASSKSWIYFPDADCSFYRVTVFSRYSPFNVPDASRFWSLLVETSETDPRPQVDRIEQVIDGLLAADLIASRSQVHHTWHQRLERGYPVPTLGRNHALEQILPVLESHGVYSRGRFGAWKYEASNQDHSFAQGVEAVDRLVLDVPERTLVDPASVNRQPA